MRDDGGAKSGTKTTVGKWPQCDPVNVVDQAIAIRADKCHIAYDIHQWLVRLTAVLAIGTEPRRITNHPARTLLS
ncbi:MAG: hypothetical protein V3T19_08005 [Acidiferrobacterales bacterium]